MSWLWSRGQARLWILRSNGASRCMFEGVLCGFQCVLARLHGNIAHGAADQTTLAGSNYSDGLRSEGAGGLLPLTHFSHVYTSHLFPTPSRCRIKSSMVTTFKPYFFAKARHPFLLIIPNSPVLSAQPSTSSPSSTNSAITPTGSLPASRQNSTAASVCPARVLTPPSRACSGTIWPGFRNVSFLAFGSARRLHVKLLSCALIPVVVPSAASIVIV